MNGIRTQADYDVEINDLSLGFKYDLEHHSFLDSEDRYRLDYIRRKVRKPINLLNTMTEGMVEDFFGAWAPEEDDSEMFDPGLTNIIFPIP